MRFFVIFAEIYYINQYFLYFNMKVIMAFQLFAKAAYLVKDLVLEFWSKNLKTNQNAGFIKLQYLTNEWSYEVEFLYVLGSLHVVKDP